MKWSLRHKSDGKIYPWLSQTTTLMFRGFYRKLYFYNLHKAPADQPVLLAANHPTAFMDPCLLGTYFDPPMYFMTRGDVFRKPFVRRLMESVNMFPVYRMRDGYNEHDRNDVVFDYVAGKLRERKMMCIFVEGEHHLEKRVKPVQKGIARIAFQAFEADHLEDLQILPAGCNYQYGDRARDEVAITLGEPIFVRDYWEQYTANPAAAMRKLCEAIEKGLKEICYHLADPADDPLAEQLFALSRAENAPTLLPVIERNTAYFEREKAVCERVNSMTGDAKKSLFESNRHYFNALHEARLDDAALLHPQWASWQKTLLLIAGFLPFLVGRFFFWPLERFAVSITRKKVHKVEFRTSVLMGAGHFVGMAYYFLLFLLSLATFNPFWITLGLLLPLMAWWSALYAEWFGRWKKARRAKHHPARNALLSMRSAVLADQFSVV